MRLRPYIREKDFKSIANWVKDEKIHALWSANLMPYPLTEEGFEKIISKCEKEFGDSAYVATTDEGKTVGFFIYSVRVTDNSGFFKFIVLNNELRGMGYGTQMMKLALKYAFEITNVDMAQLNVFDINEAAKGCYTKAGFKEHKHDENVFPYKDEIWGRINMHALKTGIN